MNIWFTSNHLCVPKTQEVKIAAVLNIEHIFGVPRCVVDRVLDRLQLLSNLHLG